MSRATRKAGESGLGYRTLFDDYKFQSAARDFSFLITLGGGYAARPTAYVAISHTLSKEQPYSDIIFMCID